MISYPRKKSVPQSRLQRKSSLGEDRIDEPMNEFTDSDPLYEEQDLALKLIVDADDSHGDESMHSSEENDIVDHKGPISIQLSSPDKSFEFAPFRQIDYLWLFNPYLHFSQRPGFVLDDSCLSLEDYSQMRYLNRTLLSAFLSDVQQLGISDASKKFSELHTINQTEENFWADEFLDEELKPLLKTRNNGAYLTVDITAHMEYLYNTLECSNKTDNPFKNSSKYPALLYPVRPNKSQENGGSPALLTLLQLHRQTIFPQVCMFELKKCNDGKDSAASVKSTTDSGNQLTPVPKMYTWYPNKLIESPMKTGPVAESPGPKSISSYVKHSSVIIRNDPMTPQSSKCAPSQFQEGYSCRSQKQYGQMNFGQASSAVKTTTFGGLSKGCSLNPKVLAVSTPMVVSSQQRKNSALCAVSDFDADSFM